MLVEPLLLLHAAATFYMTGLIWFVQVVHYPLFKQVSPDRFAIYSEMNQRRTTLVVVPAMLLELGTAIALVTQLDALTSRSAAWAGLALLGLIWLSTALLQVPAHRRLLSGYDLATIDRLVRSNWLRTITWTLRAGIALWLLRWGSTA
jgi:hypothetical protein